MVRLQVLVLAAVVACCFVGARTALAAGIAPHAQPVGMAQQQPVDDHDDTRVEVQLVVAGIAAGLVVGAGTLAYLLRKRLGLVAGPPEQDANAHH